MSRPHRPAWSPWIGLAAATLALAASLPSCAGTEVGNPSDQAELTVEFAVVTAPGGALTLADGVELDEVWLLANRLQVRSTEECAGEEGEEEGSAPVVVEIISGTELPGPIELSRMPGSFCRFEMNFGEEEEGVLPAGTPAQLAGASVYVAGRRADGTPFELRSDLHDELRIEAECEPFSLQRGRHRLVIGFAVDRWLPASSLDSAEVGDGLIRIDADNNPALLEAFELALSSSAQLYRDANRDGFLSGGESERPLTACGSP